MCELFVEGGEHLRGELTIQGSKNSVLPMLAATLLAASAVRLLSSTFRSFLYFQF